MTTTDGDKKYKLIELPGSAHIEWMYPNIYGDEKRDRISIGLCHVRAANDITIEYNAERDGWVIMMNETREVPGGAETVKEDVEVAFIPAWLEKK